MYEIQSGTLKSDKKYCTVTVIFVDAVEKESVNGWTENRIYSFTLLMFKRWIIFHTITDLNQFRIYIP